MIGFLVSLSVFFLVLLEPFVVDPYMSSECFGRRKAVGCKPGSVISEQASLIPNLVIYLLCRSPCISSDLPLDIGRATLQRRYT